MRFFENKCHLETSICLRTIKVHFQSTDIGTIPFTYKRYPSQKSQVGVGHCGLDKNTIFHDILAPVMEFWQGMPKTERQKKK